MKIFYLNIFHFFYSLYLITNYSFGSTSDWTIFDTLPKRVANVLNLEDGEKPIYVKIVNLDDTVFIKYEAPPIDIDVVDTDYQYLNKNFTKINVKMGNADEYPQPKIPYIPCRIIIPSEKEIESITVERSGEAVYDNSYFIEPGEKGISPSDPNIEESIPNPSI